MKEIIWTLQSFILVVSAYNQEGRPREKPRFHVGFIADQITLRTAFGYSIMMNNRELDTVDIESRSMMAKTLDSYTFITKMCELMSKGIFTLFSVHNMDVIHTVKSFSKTFRMPYVTPSMAVNFTGQEHGYEIYMRPLYTPAIAQIIARKGWSKIMYIYDEDEGMYRLEQLQEVLFGMGVHLRVDVLRIPSSDDVYNLMSNYSSNKEVDSVRILLDLTTSKTEKLFNLMLGVPDRSKFHFILMGLDIDEMDLPGYVRGGMNITGLRLVDFKDSVARHYLKGWENLAVPEWPRASNKIMTYEESLTIDCLMLIVRTLQVMRARNPDVFKDAYRGDKIFNNGTQGIDCNAEPILPWFHGPEIIRTMKEVAFEGTTGKVKFDRYGLRQDYSLDIMECNMHTGLTQHGEWNQEEGIKFDTSSPAPPKGNNTFSNKTRVITSIFAEPFLMLKPDFDRYEGNDRFEGFSVDLSKAIADNIGFKYEIRPVKDEKYGRLLENSTWDGMVGELIRHEADLAIAPLTITAVREKVIDFSKPFMSLGISIIIKKPSNERPGVFSFMYPLSMEIWMCVIFAYIGVSVVLFLVSRFSPFEWHIEDTTEGPSVTNNFTISNSLWFGMGAFMQQGCDIEPRSTSGRIVGSVWWFFTLIIISSYTANLAAFLTVERMNSPIESADDLAKQTEIKYGTVDGGSTYEFFKTSSIPTYQRMWAFMESTQPGPFMRSNKDGVKRVRESNGKYAFLIESTLNEYTNQRQPCDTMKVGSNLDSKGYGIGTPRGSDLRDYVTLSVLELREQGILHKLRTKWWIANSQCGQDTKTVKTKQDATSALKVMNVQGVFYILVGGLALALVTSLLEFLYKAHMEARRRKSNFASVLCSRTRLAMRGSPESPTAKYSGMVNDKKSVSTYWHNHFDAVPGAEEQ